MVGVEVIPPVAVVLVAAGAAPLLGRRAGHALGFVATLAVLGWALWVPAGTHLPTTFLGFDAALVRVDAFSRLMGVIFGFIGAAAVVYAYASDARSVQTAYALSYVGTSLGAVFAGDWLTLLFFWELMAVTSTLLVWDYGGRAVRAGFRYALLHGIGGSLLMAGIVWHYASVGSFLFEAAPGITPGLPAVLAALGIGVNVGFVGLHAWLPDTYPRPHVAASVFLCVYTTKTGVYGMYRAFPDGHLLIAYMGGAMAVVGVAFALVQDDMRRLLSYHIQSQVGYMVAGVGLGSALATAGAFAHVYNHILYKSLLFMTVGVIIYRTGGERLSELGGLGREMPLTAITFGVAALSIAGFPGFNGFVSKGMVVTAAHEQHRDALWYLLLAGGVGTFMSFIKLGYSAFLHGESELSVRDATRGQALAMVTVAGLCVVYGLYPDVLFTLLPGEGASEAHPFTVAHIAEGLILATVGLIGFAVVRRPLKKIGRVPDIDAVYNPAVYYATRGLVRGVTGSYAAIDHVAVALTSRAIATARRPDQAVIAASERVGLPIQLAGSASGETESEETEPTIHLRTSIATGVLLVVMGLVVALAVVL